MSVLRLIAPWIGLLCAQPAVPQPVQPLQPAGTYQDLEAILVTGERPGPGLWKVTRRNREETLWILPTVWPLPDTLSWQTGQVEQVIREARQVHFLTRINPPGYLSGDETARAASLNVDGRLLRDVLPPETHRQFQDLTDRYGNGLLVPQTLRPLAAVEWLKQQAMQRLRLTSDAVVGMAVHDLATRYGVETAAVRMKHDEVWDVMYKRLDRTPREADVPCAQERLDRLEQDLRDSVARANAWARGDIEALRTDARIAEERQDGKVCRAYFKDIDVGVEQQRALRRYTLAESQEWLKKNRSTLILVPIADLFGRDGLLAGLQKRGYQIEEPPPQE